MKYTQEQAVEYDYYNDEGEEVIRLVTKRIGFGDGPFELAVWQRLAKEFGAAYEWGVKGPVLLTYREMWSGYSEYTITDQWWEATVSVVNHDFERTFETMSEFLAWLGEA